MTEWRKVNTSQVSVHDICVFFQIAQDKGEKMKGDPMDLRLDIERRKKYCCHNGPCAHHHDGNTGSSQVCGREKTAENLSMSNERAKCVDLQSAQSDLPPYLWKRLTNTCATVTCGLL